MLRKCKLCGEEFDRGGTRAIYCSPECCRKMAEAKRKGAPKRRKQIREAQRRWRARQKEKRQA